MSEREEGVIDTAGPEADEFSVTVREIGTNTVIEVVGELDIATAPTLREHLLEVGHQHPTIVVLELGGLTFIDSTGISLLIASHQRLQNDGGDLRLAGIQATVGRVLRMMQLDTIFSIFDDSATALVTPLDSNPPNV